jgi:citrate synthase
MEQGFFMWYGIFAISRLVGLLQHLAARPVLPTKFCLDRSSN